MRTVQVQAWVGRGPLGQKDVVSLSLSNENRGFCFANLLSPFQPIRT